MGCLQGEGGGIADNLAPAEACRPGVVQRAHLAGDRAGSPDLVAKLQSRAPLRPSRAPGRAAQPLRGAAWGVGTHLPAIWCSRGHCTPRSLRAIWTGMDI